MARVHFHAVGPNGQDIVDEFGREDDGIDLRAAAEETVAELVTAGSKDEDWSGWTVVARTDDGGRRLKSWSFEELAA